MISIIVPSYGRPRKVMDLIRNIKDTTYVDYEINIVVEPEQVEDYEHISEHHVNLYENERTKNYAGAVNTAAAYCDFENYFLAADDVLFHKGWDVEALKVMDALETIKVVGTNDLYNGYTLKGIHATHYLVSREYVDLVGGVVDGELGHVLFEGYDHNYTDTEFIGTAKARAVFAPCLASVVEHIGWTRPHDFNDNTKTKTNDRVHDDSSLYVSRQHLWWNLSV